MLIACGRNHTVLATGLNQIKLGSSLISVNHLIIEKGNIYTFGSNSEGQLGIGDNFQNSYANVPQKVEKLDSHEWLMLAAGSGHSVALSSKIFNYLQQNNE